MIIPPIGTKGVFTFAEPFGSLISDNQIFEVAAVRSLTELQASEENPFDTIYKAVKLTEVDFKEDVKNSIPIIVFKTEGGEFFYVPGDRILSEPIINGVKYRDTGLTIELGYLPIDFDLTVLLDTIKEDVYDFMSLSVVVNPIPLSSIVSVSHVEDLKFRTLLESKKTVDKSYKTRYKELLELYNKQKTLLEHVENMVISGQC